MAIVGFELVLGGQATMNHAAASPGKDECPEEVVISEDKWRLWLIKVRFHDASGSCEQSGIGSGLSDGLIGCSRRASVSSGHRPGWTLALTAKVLYWVEARMERPKSCVLGRAMVRTTGAS